MLRLALIAVAVVLACAPPVPSESPSPSAPASLRLLVGDTSETLAQRARLLALAGVALDVTSRAGRRGSGAIAELVGRHAADPRVLAVAGGDILAGEILDDVSPRLAETVPIAHLASEPFVLAVAPNSPVADARDLRRRLERDASTVRFAGGPQSSLAHLLAAAVVRDATKRASALVYAAHATPEDAISAVTRGQSQVVLAPLGAIRQAIAESRLRALAVSSASRVTTVTAPTLRESGIDVVLVDWALVVAAPGVGVAEARALRELASRAHRQPGWPDAVRQNGWVDDFATEGLNTFLGTELTRTIALLRDLALVK